MVVELSAEVNTIPSKTVEGIVRVESKQVPTITSFLESPLHRRGVSGRVYRRL